MRLAALPPARLLQRLSHQVLTGHRHYPSAYLLPVMPDLQPSIQKFFVTKPPAKRAAAAEDGVADPVKKLKSTPEAVAQSTEPPSQPSTATAAAVTSIAGVSGAVAGATPPAADVARPDTTPQAVPVPAPKPKSKLQLLLTEPSWAAALASEFSKPYFRKLEAFLEAEAKTCNIFPAPENIFRAMNSCPLKDVRVVILGQDPYHDVGQAMGLSFSVPAGKTVPPSLQNMFRELKTDCGCTVPRHGDLQKWADQGVLLLNNALTVRAHKANSHKGKGWEQFTDAAVELLSSKRTGLVFLLWGKNAQDKAKGGTIRQASKQHILQTVHPSPLSASKGFFGCRHFSQANALLQQEGLPPVDWQIV